MKRHPIPNTDLEPSALCLGTGSFGTAVKGDDGDRLVAAFLEGGGNFFDTAHCYACWVPGGLGASERELAASLRRVGGMEQAVIATKGGHPEFGAEYVRPADFLAPEVLAADIDDSLQRLGIETIDLYYLHRDDGRTPVGEIIEALNAEIGRGRIRYLGASNWSVPRLAAANAYAEAHGLRGFVASSPQWSLAQPNWSIDPDPTVRYVTDAEIAWHTDSGVPLVVYSATANGYFAGKSVGWAENPTNAARRDRARDLASRRGCTPTQIALAYLLCQTPLTILIFSTGRVEHLRESLGALEVELSAEERRWLRDG